MRRRYSLCALALLMCLCCLTVRAADSEQIPVILCYGGDAHSVDYVFSVSEGAEISSVRLTIDDCHFDWNYVEAEARLYIALASADILPKTGTVAEITASSGADVRLVSAVVDGRIKDGVYAAHTEEVIPAVAPTCDGTGLTAGKKCAECGWIMEAPETVPAKGPEANAVLAADGTLTVTGVLSDNPTTDGVTRIAVYDGMGRMLAVQDITDSDQSEMSAVFAQCRTAATVRIFRWDAATLQPLQDALEITVGQP